MLGKLLKYDFKATVRLFFPMYIVLLAYSVIFKIILTLSLNKIQIPQAISMIVYIMIFAGIFVMTFAVMIQRFYKKFAI